jgi:DNA-binding NtrC family response regulator
MAPPARVLLVDDDPDFCEALSDRLRSLGFQVSVADRGPEALRLCREEPPAIVLLDLVLPGMDGMAVLETIRREEPDAVVIVITGHGTIARAVEAMKKGAYDFVSKPIDPRHLEIVLGKALERQALRDANALLSSEVGDRYAAIVGDSSQMRAALDVARRAAPSGATVLLLGESGTGKEVIARAIHRWSHRAEQPFVVVNCVALSEELLESELFGHEKGSFTGAHQQKRGKLEVAHGGTVFLDEIGDIRPALQAKLLRVLQDQTFERVGGTRPIQTDVRFVAATNRDLRAAVRDGLFRLDLYYRLDVVSVTLPPLRERPGDVPALAQHFLGRFRRELKRELGRLSELLGRRLSRPVEALAVSTITIVTISPLRRAL